VSDPARVPARRTGKVATLVAHELLGQITGRGLRAGDRLPLEAEMMAEYDVGRATVREALRLLEVNGIITIRPGPGGGPVVRGALPHDFGRMASLFFQAGGLTMREVVEARLILEPVTARLAAQRRTPEDLARLQALVAPAVGPGRPGAESAYRTTTSDFHAAVVQVAGNGVIALYAHALAEVFHGRVHGNRLVAGEGRSAVVALHQELVEAIATGDAVRAEALMGRHMADYVADLEATQPRLLDEVVDWVH
jgi:GntR family transcriptional regulator, transcriptional repressor for pyruvate dehydrogenase complex